MDLFDDTPLGEELKKRGVEGNPAQKLFDMMYSEDCKADPNCDPILCECGGIFETVFGSVPLLIKCVECGKESILRDLVKGL